MGTEIFEVKQPTEAEVESFRKREDEQTIKEAQDALRKVIEICERYHNIDCEYCPYFSAQHSACVFNYDNPCDLTVEEEPIVRVVL